MPLRSAWILAFGLALLCPAEQAGAVPSHDDAHGKWKDRGASSIQLQRPEQVRARSYDAWQSGVSTLPPGLRERDALPPGLRERDELPPGLRERDEFPPGLRERDDFPPGLRERDEFPPGLRDDFDGRARAWRGRVVSNLPLQDLADSSSPIPEPTGLLLFSGGLLIVGAAVHAAGRGWGR